MPRATSAELTPFRSKDCWKKFRKGKVYYIGQGQTKPDGSSPWSHPKFTGKRTDCSFYQRALEDWNIVRSKLEADESNGIDTSTADYQKHLKQWRKQVVDLRGRRGIVSTLALNDFLRGGKVASQQSSNGQLSDAPWVNAYHAPPLSAPQVKSSVSGTGISGLIHAYLADQRAKVPTQFSEAHYGEMCDKLKYFEEYSKAHGLNDIAQLNASQLQHFHNEQLQWLSASKQQGGVSRATVKKRLDRVKNLLLWCEEFGVYQTPGYLLKFNKVKAPRIDPETAETNGSGNPVFSVPEIRELWNLATARMCLYMLLGLNCGFTQVDCSTLHWNHYDKATGKIDRLRNKTKHHKHAVRQVFKLWPETISLLQQFADPIRTGLILKNENGNELLARRIKPDGGVSKIDSINLAFNRLRFQWFKQQIFAEHPELAGRQKNKAATKEKNEQLDLLLREKSQSDNRGFKVLRKSAANELEHSADYKIFVSLFLAHSEKGTKRFYTNPDYVALVPATDFLRELYALTN